MAKTSSFAGMERAGKYLGGDIDWEQYNKLEAYIGSSFAVVRYVVIKGKRGPIALIEALDESGVEFKVSSSSGVIIEQLETLADTPGFPVVVHVAQKQGEDSGRDYHTFE